MMVGIARGATLSVIGALVVAAGTSQAAERTVTFSKDVAPIFQAKCQSCHEPGSIAPMSLITYKEARPWAKSIRARVAARQMPPWHIDKSVGVQKFKNDMSLSDEQLDTILAWIDQGALEGNPADMPKPRPPVTSLYWQAERDGFGPPDLIVKSPEYKMPAVSQDQWWRPTSEIPGLNEARWVRMVEIRPSNLEGRKILHHSIAHLVLKNDPEAVNRGIASGRRRAADDPQDLVDARPNLMEWAIGKGYDRYPDGTGKLILPGETISWDQHVHAVGEEVTAGSELGIWLYKQHEEPKHRIYLVPFTGLKNGSQALDIPPNSIAHTEGFSVLKENTVITNFQPHFHLRGKAMTVEAILPDGSSQIISHVENFNFNWMTNYIYTDDAAPAFPKGTVIHVTAYYDNTTGNKDNPDPNQWVGYGDRTVDEMAHAWMNIYYLSDAEYKEYVESRKKTTTNDNQRQ